MPQGYLVALLKNGKVLAHRRVEADVQQLDLAQLIPDDVGTDEYTATVTALGDGARWRDSLPSPESDPISNLYFYFSLTFIVTVIDSSPTKYVEGAEIEIDGQVELTGADGLATFSLIPGTYNYTITKENYYDVTGIVTLGTADQSESVEMQAVIMPELPGLVYHMDAAEGVIKDGSNLVSAWESCGGDGFRVNPIMTSNVAPAGTASASTAFSTDYAAWKALDGDPATYWSTTTAGVVPCWIAYEFAAAAMAQIINKYVIQARAIAAPKGSPKDWKLQGWNGSAWVDLHTVTNQTGWGIRERREFVFNNEKAYIKYQLAITANNDLSTTNIALFELYGENIATQATVESRPVWVAGGVNSRPVVRFDNDTLAFSAMTRLTAESRVFVLKTAIPEGTTSRAVYRDYGFVLGFIYFSEIKAFAIATSRIPRALQKVYDQNVWDGSRYLVVVVTRAGDDQPVMRINGATKPFDAVRESMWAEAITHSLGGVHPADIAEVIVCDKVLPTTTIEALETVLMYKYGVS